GCCTIEDARDARRAADVLGIPFYVWDLAERFERDVVEDFVAEYAAGRTPNPCVRCNERVKFAAVLDRAVALGFDAVCTGHYARVVDGSAGPELHRSVDAGKDQSYVLGVLTRDQLERALFPVGPFRCGAQLRAHGDELPARAAVLDDGRLAVVLERAAVGVAPGQTVVLYDGTRVVGSATVARTAA